MIEDAKRALRGLARAPGFTVAVVLTLGLGVGATAALFTVVDGVLLTPIPYPEPERIVSVSEELETAGGGPVSVSYVNGTDWKAESSSFEAMALFRAGTLTLTGADQAVNLSVLFADPEYFDVLGASAEIGRFPTRAENVVPGGHPLAVISYSLWQGRLGGDADVLGRRIELSGTPYTVVGVMPAGFRDPFPSQSGGLTDLWAPAAMAGQVDPRGEAVLTDRRIRTFAMVGLMSAGETPQGAEADLDRIADRLEEQYPGVNRAVGVSVIDLTEAVTNGIRDTVLLLMGGAVVLLSLACFNVMNLLLVRASTRRREVSVHLALGAARARIARLTLLEGVCLAVAGGALGVSVARMGLPVLLSMVPNQLPVVAAVALDGSVVAVMTGITLAVGVVVGLLPALGTSSADLSGALTEARGGVGDRIGDRIRAVLVTVELCTATVLLVGTLLLTRGFVEVTSTSPGFETERIMSARVTLASARYPDEASLAQGIDELTRAVSAVGGVEWAAPWGPARPGQSGFFQSSVPDGMEPQGIAESPLARRQHVGPGVLEDMGIELLAGRTIAPEDRMDAERVAVVSESMARELWPGQDPLGRVFHGFTPPGAPRDPGRTWVVVGVVADAQNGGRVPSAGMPTTDNDAYFPMAQRPERSFTLLVRTRGEPDIGPIREAVGRFDPDVPVFAVATMDELMAMEEAPVRFAAILMTFFGLSALALSGLGVYGVVSYAVSRRTREIGLRAALGASRGRVLRRYLAEGLGLGFTGVVAGSALTLAIAPLVGTLGVIGLEPGPWSLTSASAALLVIAVAGCLFPAWRASRVDPSVALGE